MRRVELPNPARVAPIAARKDTKRKITSPPIVPPSYYNSQNFKTVNSFPPDLIRIKDTRELVGKHEG
jgi:hypothetical protein